MKSQLALNPDLANHFEVFNFVEGVESKNFCPDILQDSFEEGKVLVIEGLIPEKMEFFIELPKKVFKDWVPPIYDNVIRKKYNRKHALKEYYKDKDTIIKFQKNMDIFQESWKSIHLKMFPHYDFADIMWSWRMNAMDLGFLHLDIPESCFQEQQMRSFINISSRPRIIEFGPSLEELINKFINTHQLKRFFNLPSDKFIEAIKYEVLKKYNYEDLYLPRHYLTLAPGAMWICNAFLITHGLVFGEKTVCLEGRVRPDSMKMRSAYFHNVVENIKNNIWERAVKDFGMHV